MTTQIYNKLIRDKIPEIIEENQQKAFVRTLSENEYFQALKKKLVEEVGEFNDSEELEELADVLEVVYALADSLKVEKGQLEQLRLAKYQARGGFEKRLFLEKVTSNRS